MQGPPISTTVPSSDGVTVVAHDHGGDGPPVLWCHATGFHGRYWDPLCARLRNRWRCVTIDFRGHGDSTVPDDVELDWEGLADDVSSVVAHLDLGPVLGVGHSMGGCAILLAELASPGTFRGAWAFEPIVIPSDGGPFGPVDQPNPLAGIARRRRSTFSSRDEAFERYASRPPFARCDPEMLRAYIDYGLEDRADGTVELKCSGEREAQVYERSRTGVYEKLGAIDVPMVVAGSGDGDGPAIIAPIVADQLSRGRYEPWPDLTHFGPMEDPDAVARAIDATLTEFVRSGDT